MNAESLTVFSLAGLCNRLKILFSGKVIAEAGNRDFTMLWPLTPACACPFDALFENTWNVLTVPASQVAHLPYLSGWYHTLPDLLNARDPEITLGYVDWLIKPGLYPNHDQLWKDCQEQIRALRPLPHLQEKVDRYRDRFFRPEMIGVHLRRGDFLRARPDASGNTRGVMDQIDRQLETWPRAGIFLCTDDGAADIATGLVHPEGVRDILSRRYGARLVTTTPRSHSRDSAEAIQDALIDLLLLRQTDMIIGTQGSTFSQMAALGRRVPAAYVGGARPGYRRLEFWARLTGVYYLVNLLASLQFKRGIPFIAAWQYYLAKIAQPAVRVLERWSPGVLAKVRQWRSK